MSSKSDQQSSSNTNPSGKTFDQPAILSAIRKEYNLSDKQMDSAKFNVQDGKFSGITIPSD